MTVGRGGIHPRETTFVFSPARAAAVPLQKRPRRIRREMSSDGGELCSARCAEQPFDVAFHPGNNGIFVSGLITGAVSTRRRRLRPIFRDVAAVCLVNPH